MLVIGAAFVPAPARAAEEEVQFWVTGTAAVPLAEDVSGTFELSRRFRNGDDQLLLRGIADYRVSDRVSIGGGLAYVDSIDGLLETGDDREVRLQQQLTLSFGALSFRTRLEERFFESSDRMQVRVRQRIQASGQVARELQASLSAEMFYIARSDDPQSGAGISQWRATASLSHRLSRNLQLSAGYMLMYTPGAGAPDQIAHVPQLTLTYRPG